MKLDAITAEILRNMLGAVVDTMALRLSGNAKSLEIVEGKAFANALLDRNGVVTFIDNPLHLASMELTAKAVLDKYAFDMQPGDIFLTNDPYGGGSHQLDFTIVSPYAVEVDSIMFLAVRAKMPDIGGQNVGGFVPEATELWAEGARFPPLRICRDGKIMRDALTTFYINSRFGDILRGNLDAMMLALKVGKNMIASLIDDYSLNAVLAALDYSKSYSERYIRSQIAGWQDGQYAGTYFIDHDGRGGKKLKVTVTVTVEGDTVGVDFTGTDPQSQSFINATYGDLCSYAALPFLLIPEESVPRNAGLLRPIKFTAPMGSMVNPIYPKPVSFSPFYPAATIATAVALALEKVLGDRAINPAAHLLLARSYGHRAHEILDHGLLGVGSSSASCETDGWGVPPLYARRLMPSIELHEREFGGWIESIEYVTDSGGAGQWRGGLGTKTTIRFNQPRHMTTIVQGRTFPVAGLAGGQDGSSNGVAITRQGISREIEDHAIECDVENACVSLIMGGGGGWGNPLRRSPDRVLDDVLDGFVSRQSSEEIYGVILNSDGNGVDAERTREKRRVLEAAASSRET